MEQPGGFTQMYALAVLGGVVGSVIWTFASRPLAKGRTLLSWDIMEAARLVPDFAQQHHFRRELALNTLYYLGRAAFNLMVGLALFLVYSPFNAPVSLGMLVFFGCLAARYYGWVHRNRRLWVAAFNEIQDRFGSDS